ncbi:MraY family glycosyltransferase [Sphingobacterium hotanense]|uniref:MraY family glycosyltransferase n=1 Tax=Sphingobacterium hotanense TaxID=649196 RepID=UPI0021A8DBF4|nr:glycosyltransferase family 4 protein [Sphingobacterium hotanense]MCT1523539.1 glycosyltransferase family 4 protein [Sphingobacterium hotanense]
MKYLIVFIALFLLELIYFKIADYFNIIDKPNDRSSHTSITLRGGGVIFYFGALLFFFLSDFQYPWFFIGLTLMSSVSFMDDIFSLPNKIRLLVHFISVLLMAYELDIFSFPWYYLVISFVVIVGVINAYNFMDGINGMTSCYSLVISGLLLIVNDNLGFINQDLLIFSSLGVLVFAFFNFRTRAKSFAGDVGSVSIAFILLYCLGSLIIKTGNFIYILFLAIYGIDTVWTIIRRLSLRENIFEAHRTHLYQFLGNEAKINKLYISSIYGTLQLLVGLMTIYFSKMDYTYQIGFSISIICIGSLVYLLIKNHVIKNYVNI